MLSIKLLNQYYGDSHILRDLSLEVPQGRLTALMGRNGVGKSSLLKCLMGVVPARSGSIAWSGQALTRLPPWRRVSQGLAYVPQGRDIFARLSVEENLLVGAASRRAPRGIPAHIYQLFPVLESMKHRRGGDLSGGQQQQLAIARALMSQPQLLILDEPTEGIQPNIIQQIGRTLRLLVDEMGLTVLLVEQYYDFCAEHADFYAVMQRGAIVATGKGSDMQARGVQAMLAI
ncbi:urea ABC transporter ATP-binding subunit UrtE [Comamonas composti]|uniref:urea ABC transporter ATP-binding subunit UrtE n=1 Tax=Comamonas composti TaxID=408558 RepID=UPI00041AEDB3|nr:urea ABC transporter ATP-binding subunit UrtE [Comamonas composti]